MLDFLVGNLIFLLKNCKKVQTKGKKILWIQWNKSINSFNDVDYLFLWVINSKIQKDPEHTLLPHNPKTWRLSSIPLLLLCLICFVEQKCNLLYHFGLIWQFLPFWFRTAVKKAVQLLCTLCSSSSRSRAHSNKAQIVYLAKRTIIYWNWGIFSILKEL